MVAALRVGACRRARRRTFTIEFGSAVAGCIQYSEETDSDYFSAAVDIFVGTAAQGRGVGRDAMRTLIAWLFDVRGHHRLTVDPAAGSARASTSTRSSASARWACSEGTSGSRTSWRDALLMELLEEDFRRA